MKQILSLYLQNQIKIIEENLVIAKKNFDVEAIHDFRVGVKKTKALFLFTDEISRKSLKVKRRLKALRKLFKTAGRLRDVQIQTELLHKYEKKLKIHFTAFSNYLKRNENTFMVESGNAITEFDFNGLYKLEKNYNKHLSKSKDDKILKKTLKVINKRFAELIEFANDFSDIDNIHEFRIKLKEFIHIEASLNKNPDYFDAIPVDYKELKEIGSILGIWHDKIVLVENLEDFMKEFSENYEQRKENYDKLMSKTNKDIDNHLLDLDKKLKEVKIK